jgi:hypothetical protein
MLSSQRKENGVTGYGALSDMYEWVIPDGMLSPADSVAARRVELTVETTTFDPGTEVYMVVAVNEEVQGVGAS